MVRYFLLRFFLFVGCVLVLWLVGLRQPLPLVLVAGVLSSIISLVAFRGMRQHAADGLEHRVHERMARAEAHRTAEDEDDEED